MAAVSLHLYVHTAGKDTQAMQQSRMKYLVVNGRRQFKHSINRRPSQTEEALNLSNCNIIGTYLTIN